MIPGSATPLFLLNQGDSAYKIERSLRFNDNDSAYLSRTPSSAGNRKTWTWSGWVKKAVAGTDLRLFDCSASSTDQASIKYLDTDKIQVFDRNSGTFNLHLQTSAVFRDSAAWHHIVVAIDTTQSTSNNRAKLYINGSQVEDFSTETYPSQNHETRFNATNSHLIGKYGAGSQYFNGYLAEVHFIDGQQLAATDFGEEDSNGVWQPIEYTFGTNPNNGTTWSTGVAGDNQVPNSQAFDGSLSTWAAPNNNGTLTWTPPSTVSVSSSLRIYAAREASTDSITVTFSDSSTFTSFDDDNTFKWYTITGAAGKTISNIAWTHANSKARISAIEVDGYVLIDGTVDNSFHLDFSDNSSNAALGYDAAGSNDWTVNNISVASGAGNDSLIDTPTNYEAASGNNGGNYCTLNPLAKGAATSLSNGNLNYVGGAANQTLGTIGMSSGKWYWEDHKISGTYGATGIALADAPLNNHPGQGNSWAYNKNGSKWHNGSSSSYGATWDSGDTIGIAFDADAGTLVFYKNGVSQGTAFTGLTNGPYFVTGADNSVTGYFNFGASGSFAYTPPTGHKSLCTQNLPDPTIANGADHFYALASTGTFGGGTVTDSNANFTPDLVWVKRRNAAERHKLYDVVRGTDGTRYKHLESDGSDAEGSGETGITAFVAGGYTSEGGGHINSDGQPFISWMWDGGTSTVSNTDGSITSSVRANASAGFSIVSYTGNNGSSGTIGHGLNAAPSMFIVKNRGTTTDDWIVYHKSLGATKRIKLNSTAAADTNSSQFNDTEPTSSVFTVGSLQNINDNYNYIAYCFAPVEGYSAFGSYTGNGSSDGPFIHTGFKVAFLLYKRTDSSQPWYIVDEARDPDNVALALLSPNDSAVEDTGSSGVVDLLSNGFKPRASFQTVNASGGNYIYMAFAENPFQANGGLAR